MNPLFLDAVAAAERVIGPAVLGLGAKAGPILFQFSPMGVARGKDSDALVDRLGAFLAALPRGPLYAVEVRDASLVGPRYLAALEASGVAHGFTLHPTMPGVRAQAALLAGADPRDTSALEPAMERVLSHAPALVCRWMLHATQKYEGARGKYFPFDRLVDEDLLSRQAVARMCLLAAALGRETWVIANNKAEGSAPLTLRRLAEVVGAASGPRNDERQQSGRRVGGDG
jgi:uncharacterized protein YecE (DUF72 family)